MANEYNLDNLVQSTSESNTPSLLGDMPSKFKDTYSRYGNLMAKTLPQSSEVTTNELPAASTPKTAEEYILELQKAEEENQRKVLEAQENLRQQQQMANIVSGFEKMGSAMAGRGLANLTPDYAGSKILSEQGKSDYEQTVNQLKLGESNKLKLAGLQAQIEAARQKASDKKEDREFKNKLLELKARQSNDPFAREDYKEEKVIRKENRSKREKLIEDEQTAQTILDQVKDAKKYYQNFSSDSKTGYFRTLGGLTAKTDFFPKDQMLHSKFAKLSLDNLIKSFSGMSQLVNTEKERAAFESSQPKITNQKETNDQILEDMEKAATRLLNKVQARKNEYTKMGDFTDKPDTQVEPTKSPPKQELSEQDKQAKNWADKNPSDPRSAAILEKLKAKGFLI